MLDTVWALEVRLICSVNSHFDNKDIKYSQLFLEKLLQYLGHKIQKLRNCPLLHTDLHFL